MKHKRFNECLFLIFVTVCSMLFMTSLNAFAAHTDGSTEVIAHIEKASDETTQSVTDSTDSPAKDDENIISTGKSVSFYVIIFSLLLIVSVLVIYFCRKNDKCNNIQDCEY